VADRVPAPAFDFLQALLRQDNIGWESIVISTVLFVLVLGLLGLELLFQFVVLKVALPIFEGKPPFGSEHYPHDESAEAVTIPTSYGLRLQGSLFRTLRGRSRGLILFCHELDSDRWSALGYCEGLLAAGFDVLAFDFRNHGDSDAMPGYEPTCWLTTFEVDDVLAAVAYIASRPDLRNLPLGTLGVSRGGGAALVAAARSASVSRTATDGAYSCNEMLLHFTARWGRLYFPDWMMRLQPRWHLLLSLWVIRSASQLRRGCRYANVEKALDSLPDKPLFMLSGERDTYVIPDITRNLLARAGQDGSGVWIVPGAKHNLARQTDPDAYDQRLVEFFSGLEEKVHAVRPPQESAAIANGQPFGARIAVRSTGMTAG
jgi:pimeloyl-ACP methyl ester carboxylesterase